MAAPRTRRRVAWVLAGGSVCAAVVLLLVLGPNTDAPKQRISNVPAQKPERQVEAPLPKEARQVAVRFIQTAVAREDLEEAWTLVGPNLRGGLTRKEWLTGNNPVVPYPIDKLEVAPYKVDESGRDERPDRGRAPPAQGVRRPGPGVLSRPRQGRLGLPGPRVVDNWVPRASAVVPR